MTVTAPLQNSESLTAAPLAELGQWLRARSYAFITPTPETHRRVIARFGGTAPTLRDIFGWSRAFRGEDLDDEAFALLTAAGALSQGGGFFQSGVRFSTWEDFLFVHSAYPSLGKDSVFFGPDTYRFLRFLRDKLATVPPRRVIDIGAGSGAGGIFLSRRYPDAEVLLADVNATALDFARVNAGINVCPNATCVYSDVLRGVHGDFDLIISNPPYLVDARARVYRDGGGALGHDLSLRILQEGLARLTPHGQMILYTGSAIIAGRDVFREKAEKILQESGRPFSYEEIDPDVFGEELDTPSYQGAERIAVVAVTVNF